jgi:hypothetical protein
MPPFAGTVAPGARVDDTVTPTTGPIFGLTRTRGMNEWN